MLGEMLAMELEEREQKSIVQSSSAGTRGPPEIALIAKSSAFDASRLQLADA